MYSCRIQQQDPSRLGTPVKFGCHSGSHRGRSWLPETGMPGRLCVRTRRAAPSRGPLVPFVLTQVLRPAHCCLWWFRDYLRIAIWRIMESALPKVTQKRRSTGTAGDSQLAPASAAQQGTSSRWGVGGAAGHPLASLRVNLINSSSPTSQGIRSH